MRKCSIRLVGGDVLEANNRTELRRLLRQFSDDQIAKWDLSPFEVYKMKQMVSQTAIEAFEREAARRKITTKSGRKKLFGEMFLSGKADKNALTMLPSDDTPNTVSSILKEKLMRGENNKKMMAAAQFRNLFKVLRMTEKFEKEIVDEDGNVTTEVVDDIFQNPIVQQIFRGFQQRGIFIDLTVDPMGKDFKEQPLENWQREVHTTSTYDGLGEKLKAKLNNVRRKRFNAKGELVDAKGFLGLPETYSFSYVYKRLITKLGNSANSDIMMQKIEELKGVDPVITQLFPDDMSSNESQKFLSLVWTKIASNYKYDFYDTIIEMKNGKVVQSVSLSNFDNNDKIVYQQLLSAGRESKLVSAGKYDTQQVKSFTKKLGAIIDKAENIELIDEAEAEATELLNSVGLFNYEDQVQIVSEDFFNVLTELYNDLTSEDQDILAIIPNSEASSLISYAAYIAENSNSIMNNNHRNHKGENVYEFNNSNFTSRLIGRIANGENIFEGDVLYEDNVVVKQLQDNKAQYFVVSGMKPHGKRRLIPYKNMSKQQLITNDMLLFHKKNAIQLPIHADSSSMTALSYSDSAVRNVDTAKGMEDLVNDLVKLVQNEVASLQTDYSVNKDNSFLYIMPELQEAYKQGTEFTEEFLKEQIPIHLERRYNDFRNYLVELNLYEVKTSSKGVKRIVPNRDFDKSLEGIHQTIVKNYVYNFSLLYPSAAIVLNGHPSFYAKKDVVSTLANYDKRTKQVWSPTTPLRVGASYTSPITKETTTVSETFALQVMKDVKGTTEAFQKKIKALKDKYADIDGRYDGIEEAFKKSSETDAQSYIDPFRYKQILVGLGEWDGRKEVIYQELIKGNFNTVHKVVDGKLDDEYFFSALKPFTFSMRNNNGKVEPLQKKDSEIVLHPMHGLQKLKNGEVNPYYNPFYRYMLENMGYEFTEDSVSTIPNFEQARSENVDNLFVDTYSFDSAIKTGQPNGQDLNLGANIDVKQEFGAEETLESFISDLTTFSQSIPDPGNNDFYEIEGQKYDRVTSVISDKPFDAENVRVKASLHVGNQVDQYIRDFFAGTTKPIKEYGIGTYGTMKPFINQLKEIKKDLEKQGMTVVAEDVLLHDPKEKVAGTVDLLMYDKNGDFYIYDIKTMKVNSPKEIEGGKFAAVHQSGDNVGKSKLDFPYIKGELSNKQKYIKQLNMYAILLKNKYGIDVKGLGIMPIGVSYNAPDITASLNSGRVPEAPVSLISKLNTIKVDITDQVKGAKKTFTKSDKTVKLAKANPQASYIKVSNHDYGKQQDVPPHFLDSTKVLAKQTSKNLRANVIDDAKYTLPSYNSRDEDGNVVFNQGRTVTGRELKEMVNALEIQEIADHYTEVTDEVKSLPDIVATLRKEIIKRGLSSNYIEALDLIWDSKRNQLATNAPLDFPAYSYKIKQIINSIYTKNVTLPKKFEGVSYINASSYGFNENTRPKIVFEGDKIKHVEALVPIHDSRLYKYVKKNEVLSKDKIQELIDKHPEMEDIFSGIVWRVPNESKYSTVPVKITGFIPTEIGSAIYLPVEVTDIAGLDFDIDKMYGFYYAFDDVNLEDRIYDVIEEVSIDYVQDIISKDPIYTLYMEEIGREGRKKTVEEFVKWIYEDGDYKRHSELKKAFNKVFAESGFVVPRDDSRKGRQNRMLDLYRTLLNHENATYETLTPASGYETVLDSIKEELGVEDTNQTGGLGSAIRVVEKRAAALDGKALVGPFANANSILAIFQQAAQLFIRPTIVKDDKTGKTKVIKRGFKFNGKIYSDFANPSLEPNRLNYKFRSQNIALWLAAIVDNAKNPYAGDLNINWATINVAISMFSAGVDFHTTMYFLNNPVIKRYAELYKQFGGDRLAESRAYAEVVKEIRMQEDGKQRELTEKEHEQLMRGYTYDFSSDSLLSMAKSNYKDMFKNDETTSLNILSSFKKYGAFGEAVRKATIAIKASEDGIGSSDGQTISTALQILDAVGSDEAIKNGEESIVGMAELILDKTKTHYHLTKLLVDLNDVSDNNAFAMELMKAAEEVKERDFLDKKAVSDITPNKSKVKKKEAIKPSPEMEKALSDSEDIQDVMSVAMRHLDIPAKNRGFFFNVIRDLSRVKKQIFQNHLTGKEIEILIHQLNAFLLTKDIKNGGLEFVLKFGENFPQKMKEHPEYRDLLKDFYLQKDVDLEKDFLFYNDSHNEIAEEAFYKEGLMYALYGKDPEFVRDLAKYALYVDGLGSSAFGFTHLIPQEAFKDLNLFNQESNDYKMSLAQEKINLTDGAEDIKRRFIPAFIRNNPSQLSFVRPFNKTNKEALLPYLHDAQNRKVYILNPLNKTYIAYPELNFTFVQNEENLVAGKHFIMYDFNNTNVEKVEEVKAPEKSIPSTSSADPKSVNDAKIKDC